METIIILSGLVGILAATATIAVEALLETEETAHELFNPHYYTVEDWDDL